jgi:hypothetical protein
LRFEPALSFRISGIAMITDSPGAGFAGRDVP